jgi:hypothetical protein
MEAFSSVLGNVITGLFALLGAFLAWRLRRKDEQGVRDAALSVEKRRELIDLYAKAFTSFEQAIKCTIEQEPYELTADRSFVNAKVRLLGSEAVNLAYDEASERLQSWSALHLAASPPKRKIGEQTVVILQAPDPREKYKAPAAEAHKELHQALRVLRERMHEDIGSA